MSCYSMDKSHHQSAGGGDSSKSKDGKLINSNFFHQQFDRNQKMQFPSSLTPQFPLRSTQNNDNNIVKDVKFKTSRQEFEFRDFNFQNSRLWGHYNFNDKVKASLNSSYFESNKENNFNKNFLTNSNKNNVTTSMIKNRNNMALRENTKGARSIVCNFCKKNGENPIVYSSHKLYNKEKEIICPILLKCKCNICQKYGHTISYCPLNYGKKSTLRSMQSSDKFYSLTQFE